MKRLLILLLLAGCQAEQPQPTTQDCNDMCKCGEVVSYFMYYPSTNISYTLKNYCSAQTIEVEVEGYHPVGSNICLDYCW